MRIIIAFTILVYIIQTTISVTVSGISAAHTDSFIPFLIMMPGTISLVFSLFFAADRIYFSQLRIKEMNAFAISLALFVSTLILLLFGGYITTQINTIELIPHYLLRFIWFPFIIPIMKLIPQRIFYPKFPKMTKN